MLVAEKPDRWILDRVWGRVNLHPKTDEQKERYMDWLGYWVDDEPNSSGRWMVVTEWDDEAYTLKADSRQEIIDRLVDGTIRGTR